MPRTKTAKFRPRSRKACDDCRARKIKCDGQSPCLACLVHDRDCAYIARMGNTKASLALHALELERENRRLESSLQTLRSQADAKTSPVDPKSSPEESRSAQESDEQVLERSQSSHDESLETMIQATGGLSIDDRGDCIYHGHFAGLTLLEGIRQLCSQMLQQPSAEEDWWAPSNLPKAFDHRDTPNPNRSDVLDEPGLEPGLLPAKEAAERLASVALDDACCLMTFIHRPTFNEMFDRIYTLREGRYSKDEQRFLPLLYAVLALGELFMAERDKLDGTNDSNVPSSQSYFLAARSLVDLTTCLDLSSLQAILFMIMYLQCSGSLSACHSYLSVAIASSLRIGLHRSATSKGLDPIQQETRKRVFWALQTMETYVTTMLGLPKALSDDFIDQVLPLEVDDKSIGRDGIRIGSTTQSSNMTAVNAHTRLMLIMSRIGNHLFSLKSGVSTDKGFYRMDFAKIIKMENELGEWFNRLPTEIDPDGPDASIQIRSQLRLRMAYAHAQMVLYRPFLHHIIRKKSQSPIELRSYACASACVKAAMQVIWLVEQLEDQGLLAGTYWLTLYMTMFASISLLMFALGNSDDPTVPDALRAAEKGRGVLARLADGNPTAQSCAASLTHLLERTPAKSTSPSNNSPHADSSATADISPTRGKRVRAPLYGTEESDPLCTYMTSSEDGPEDQHWGHAPTSVAGGLDLFISRVDQESIPQSMGIMSMPPVPDTIDSLQPLDNLPYFWMDDNQDSLHKGHTLSFPGRSFADLGWYGGL